MKHVLADTVSGTPSLIREINSTAGHRTMPSYLESAYVIVPWPVLYETLRTSFVRKRRALEHLESYLKRPNIVFIDDEPYREKSFHRQLAITTGRITPALIKTM